MAKQEANHAFHALNPDETKASDYLDAESESVACDDDLFCLLTDDTIAALIEAAEAADVFIVCNEGGEPISWLDIKAALAPLVVEDAMRPDAS